MNNISVMIIIWDLHIKSSTSSTHCTLWLSTKQFPSSHPAAVGSEHDSLIWDAMVETGLWKDVVHTQQSLISCCFAISSSCDEILARSSLKPSWNSVVLFQPLFHLLPGAGQVECSKAAMGSSRLKACTFFSKADEGVPIYELFNNS